MADKIGSSSSGVNGGSIGFVRGIHTRQIKTTRHWWERTSWWLSINSLEDIEIISPEKVRCHRA
jgi:hypothetical protein